MWILVSILLLITGALFYLFAPRDNKKSPAATSSREQPPVRHGESSPRKRATSHLHSVTETATIDDVGVLNPQAQRSHEAEELQKRIRDGVALMFSDKPPGTNGKYGSPRLEDIDPEIKKTVLGRIKQLKNFRSTLELYRALDDPKTSMAQLSKTIVLDPILSGNILKVSNSAYFGMQKRITSIGHALMVIGILNLKHILYQDGMRRLLMSSSRSGINIQNWLWEHATLTSICALHIHSLFSNVDRGTLFTLGILHDIGKFVMMDLNPMKQIGGDFKKEDFAQFNVHDEYEIFGIDHVLIGRLVFEEWGFSDQMIKTCEMHHAPSWIKMDQIALDPMQTQPILLLYLADQLAKIFATEEKGISPMTPLEPSYRRLAHKATLTNVMLDSSLAVKIRKAKALMQAS